MSFWTWSPQNNSQLNPEKLKTFKETTDVVTFYSYFFSDITDLYDKNSNSRRGKFKRLLYNNKELQNKILNMYKLLETYYDHNIINILQKSNLTNKSQIKNIINQIINHFKLQIKCKNSYRVSAENYYICEISKSIYYCLLLLLMLYKINSENKNILDSLIKTYSSKSKKTFIQF